MLRSPRPSGFSLVELLSVIAIIATLAVVAVATLPSMSSAGNSRNVNTAGVQLDNLLHLARQNSISKNAMTAVVMLTDAGGAEHAYRTVTAFELAPRADGAAPTSADWVQVWKWETLANGVLADAQASSFLHFPSVTSNLPTIRYQEKTFAPGADYACQIFLPSGALLSAPSPCTLVLRQGSYGDSGAVYQPSPNFYSFTFNNENGALKITRP